MAILIMAVWLALCFIMVIGSKGGETEVILNEACFRGLEKTGLMRLEKFGGRWDDERNAV